MGLSTGFSNTLLLPAAERKLTSDCSKWVHFSGRQWPHKWNARLSWQKSFIGRITSVKYTDSVPSRASPAPLKSCIILTDYVKKDLVPEVDLGSDGLGRGPQHHCPVCIVLSTWVGCLHRNQQNRTAMFGSEIISNGFLCSYNSVHAIFVISIWKVVQVNNLMLDCSFCFPIKLTEF